MFASEIWGASVQFGRAYYPNFTVFYLAVWFNKDIQYSTLDGRNVSPFGGACRPGLDTLTLRVWMGLTDTVEPL